MDRTLNSVLEWTEEVKPLFSEIQYWSLATKYS